MALESTITIGEKNSGHSKTFKVVECRLDVDRPYDQCSPTGFTRLENLEVTVSPDHGDTTFHKWFTEKSREEVTLVIAFFNNEGYEVEPQIFKLTEAFCHSLSESIDRAGKKSDAFRRLLKVGIKAQGMKLDESDLKTYSKKTAKKKKQEPAFVARDQNNDALIQQRAAEMGGSLTQYEKLRLAEHSIAIQAALGKAKGKPMTIEEAQKANPNFKSKTVPNVNKTKEGAFTLIEKDQNGNLVEKEVGGHVPHYIKNPQWNEATDRQYTINCATCSTAYALRRQGFDVTAKGKSSANPANKALSEKDNVFKVWKNADGTDAKPVFTCDWMEENGVYKMTPALYRQYIEENTQEEGTYILAVAWPGKDGQNDGGHATIVERWRDEDGNLQLNNVEPQHYGDKEVRRDLDKKICYRATPWPNEHCGIMRVDNKLFDTTKTNLFI